MTSHITENPAVAELQTAFTGGRAVIIVGTGVSRAICRDQEFEGHKVASWTGLLYHGIERCLSEGLITNKHKPILDLQVESELLARISHHG